jgi:hypothetical protein
MSHRAHPDFWFAYRALTPELQTLADRCFELLKADPRHPSLRLKKVGEYWSARVGLHHRALAIEIDDGLMWTWIGGHDEYERLIS